MASDYTVNYHLDKYVGTDKPNLRDQYNTAMDKIDAQLLVSSNAATQALQTAQNAAQSVSGKVNESTFNQFVSQTNTALGNKANTTALNSEAQTRQEADAALSARMNDFVSLGKYFAVIGDSFSDGSGEWPSIVAQNTGLSKIVEAKGGSAFAQTSASSAVTFINQLRNLKNNSHWNDIRHIIVYGCVNDWTDANATAAQTEGLIEAFISEFNASAYQPKLTFVLGNVGAPNRSFTRGYGGYPNYISELVEYTRRLGYDAIPAYSWLLGYQNSAVFNTDNLHPNSIGEHIIAGFMTQILNGTYSGFIRHIVNPQGTLTEGWKDLILTYDISETSCTVSFVCNKDGAANVASGYSRIFSAPPLCFGGSSTSIITIPSTYNVAGTIMKRFNSNDNRLEYIDAVFNPYVGYVGINASTAIPLTDDYRIVGERTFPIV